MKTSSRILMALALLGLLFLTPAAQAAVIPNPPYIGGAYSAPIPAVYGWTSSIAAYKQYIIYAGDDQKIYGYNTDTGGSRLVSDTSALSMFSVGGFLVSEDNYLYFHDNGMKPDGSASTSIYRVNLAAAWPAQSKALVTNCNGNIFSLTQNPWSKTIWFASAVFMGDMYLYEVDADFLGVTQNAAFAAPNGGGSGPLVFAGPNDVLYGESVWGGNGYFHLVNTQTGTITDQDLVTFPGGLAAAVRGADNLVYATSGDGKTIYAGNEKGLAAVAVTVDGAQGICVSGNLFYISEMDAAGLVSFNRMEKPFYGELAAANPAPWLYGGSIGWYKGNLLYVAADQQIYAYDTLTANTQLVSDTSALSMFNVGGFYVSDDNWLYFHDNGMKPDASASTNIYRVNLDNAWPANIETLTTGSLGTIYSLTQNPWSGDIWFCSSVYGVEMYLYTAGSDFNAVTEVSRFAPRHGGANGPIIFREKDVLLYGESVFNGNGYVHRIDPATGDVTKWDWLTFAGGLAGAFYGPDNRPYLVTGAGRKVYSVSFTGATQVLQTDSDVWTGAFDGQNLLLGQMDGGGNLSFHQYWQLPEPPANPVYPDLKPAAFAWHSAIGYYNNHVFYTSGTGDIYGYNVISGLTSLACDTAFLSTQFAGPAGFAVSANGFLYFNDNGSTQSIYRINLNNTWPIQAIDQLVTGASGSIFSLAFNPWTKTIWFASADFGGPNNMYLYEINTDFDQATLSATFAAPHGGGNGPIIFTGETSCLYGESVFGGNGYFHLVDTRAQAMAAVDKFEFEGGLAGAAYGRNYAVYATTGAGQEVQQLSGNAAGLVKRTSGPAFGIAFDGIRHWVTQMDAAGKISLYRLGQAVVPPLPGPSDIDTSGTSSSCFITSLLD